MKDMNAVKGYMQYGFDGENNYRQITFDISDLIDGFTSSDGSVMCYWQRPGDTAAYPCEDLTIDWTEETAVLILSSTETAIAGKCRCQLVFVGEDGTIGKDKIYAVNVPASLTGGDLGDAESIPWVVEVLTARDEAEQAATEAAGSAATAQELVNNLPTTIGPAVEEYLEQHPIQVPVTSVNSKTGAVVLDADDVGALADDTSYVSSFNGSSGAITYTAPVTSVNSKTGAVVLDASDVGALADNTTYVSSFNGSTGAITYTAPVTSVNGSTGAVTLTIPDQASEITNDSTVTGDYVDDALDTLSTQITNIVTTGTTVSTNKYDKDHVQAGYWLLSDGVTLVENNNYRASETYVPVVGGTTYVMWWVNNGTVEQTSWHYVAWYDSTKTFISGTAISTTSTTAPSNAAYVRFTAQRGKCATFMALPSDITPTEYISYNVASTTTLNSNIIIPQLSELSALKNVKIDVIGDSWSAVNSTASVKYTDLLTSVDGADVNVVAYSGAGFHKPTSGNQPFYTQALSIRSTADIVLIFGSFNDVSDIVDGTNIGDVTDTGTTTICGCINTTIDNILTVNPSAKIMFVTPAAWSGYNANNESNNANNATALDYVQAIKDVCFKRGYECKDALRSMNLKPWIDDFKTAYQPDGTHPNNAGHLKYVYPLIRNFLATVV